MTHPCAHCQQQVELTQDDKGWHVGRCACGVKNYVLFDGAVARQHQHDLPFPELTARLADYGGCAD